VTSSVITHSQISGRQKFRLQNDGRSGRCWRAIDAVHRQKLSMQCIVRNYCGTSSEIIHAVHRQKLSMRILHRSKWRNAMKIYLLAGTAALLLSAGVATAQTSSSESTTTQSTLAPPPAPVTPPPIGTLSSTREVHGVDAYGNRIDKTQSTYRNTNGVAQDSETTRTVVPPPVTTTTTTTSSSSTTAPQ